MGTPGPHFHYDFGGPSMNMETPQFSSMFIVEIEESAVAMNLLGQLSGEISGWLEKYGLAASLTCIKDGSSNLAILYW